MRTKRNREAEKLNQRYAKELLKLGTMQIAAQQQQDVVTDLHFKYVQAVSKDENWK